MTSTEIDGYWFAGEILWRVVTLLGGVYVPDDASYWEWIEAVEQRILDLRQSAAIRVERRQTVLDPTSGMSYDPLVVGDEVRILPGARVNPILRDKVGKILAREERTLLVQLYDYPVQVRVPWFGAKRVYEDPEQPGIYYENRKVLVMEKRHGGGWYERPVPDSPICGTCGEAIKYRDRYILEGYERTPHHELCFIGSSQL